MEKYFVLMRVAPVRERGLKYDRVLAASPEEAIKIATEGDFSEFLELYDPEVEEM